jgi:hypothetical protein
MQVNGTRVLTYVDFLKGLDAKGKFDHRVINLAVKSNEMLDDITVVEANNGTALETTYRTEVPKPVWTQYYSGTPSNKGSKAKLKVTGGRMSTKITIDKKMYDEADDKDAVIADEIMSAQDGMRLEMGNMLIYGLLEDNPLGFNGLFKHFDRYGSNDDTNSAHYVINALKAYSGTTATTDDGKTSDLGSIALVGWSPNTITCFHPQKHSQGGIEITPKRVVDVVDPDKGGDATYEAYLQYLYWNLGLAVRDFRYGGRICNIQRDYMLSGADKGASYVELIDRLSQRVHDQGVRQAWYMDKRMWENTCVLFSRLTRGNAITFQHVEARKEKRLYGIPVRIQDCMKVAEEVVPEIAA